MSLRLRSFFLVPLQRRSFGIVFFVIGALVLSHVAEYALHTYYANNWETVVEEKSREQLAKVLTEFGAVQRKARRVAAELARHDDVARFLTGHTADVKPLFERVARVAYLQDVGAEIFDRNGALIAWHGRSGVVNHREIQVALQGVLTSYVTRGPIYSQLFVISPVRVEGAVVGAVLIRHTIEVNYPLSNQFITREGLAEQLSRQLGVTVAIEYGEQAQPVKDGRFASTELNGIDGRKLGVASIQRPSRTLYLERIGNQFQSVNAGIVLLLIGLLAFLAHRRLGKLSSIPLQCLGVTLLIWIVRYALLWFDIPSVLVQLSIFDPAHFASKFAGGLAKSAGEFALTSLALLVNTAVVVRKLQSRGAASSLYARWPLAARIILGVAATTLLFLLLRGYAAAIKSAVIDSNLRFNDPKVIVPSVELALMVFNLFALGFCLIVVAAGLTKFIRNLFILKTGTSTRGSWIATGVLFTVASVMFGIIQETPLMSTPFRLLFGAALMVFSAYIGTAQKRGGSIVSLGTATSATIFAALVFYPLLDTFIHEKDRERVELLAREALRPTDAWFTFVVNDALESFASDGTFATLVDGDPEELEGLAFSCWARSAAARQGYNCVFLILDPDSNEVSRFAIGEQPPLAIEAGFDAMRTRAKGVEVRNIGTGMNAMRIYAGVLPIRAFDRLLGYGIVVVSAARQALFRGEAPGVFRTATQENLESFYRPISVTELREGLILSNTDPYLPIGYRIPEDVALRMADSVTTSLWYDERLGDKEYETLFIRRAPTSRRVVALRMEQLDLGWHLLGFVRTLVYFAATLLVGVVLFLLVQWSTGSPYRFTFRDKLLVALLVTSAVPIGVFSIYTRVFASDRVMENLAQRLDQETAAVEDALVRNAEWPASVDPLAITPEHLAASLKADFNIYAGNMLRVSSRPELYNTGILDRRMSGSAYAGLFVEGRRFVLEMENIGLYRYAVGYRPVLDTLRAVTGAIAVPTLYRQEQIDEQLAGANALLFSVSAFVFILVSIIAVTFANRIASPIHKLTAATKRVAMGDLDVRVNARADGEIQELIQSFDAMTKDLKHSRENLVQYERELAWKEMAKQVAHEIKNPLTPMKLALQHLRQTYKDGVQNFDEVFEDVSQMVIRQVDALSRIASEFSSFARMPNARLERCSLNDILREALYLFEQDRKVTFDLHLQQHLPPIMADREELRRAFINIIRNGIQAMDNAGRMTVTSVGRDAEIEIRIQDYGTGIPDEIKEKLFQPNFSTKTDGMGLGLAIVKKTIEDLNGRIALDSKVGEGTTVIIHLPYQENEREPDSVHPV